MNCYSSKFFSFFSNEISSEASTLGFPPGRIFRNFHIRSEKTGRMVEFKFNKIVSNSDDVEYWQYLSINNPIEYTLKVFND